MTDRDQDANENDINNIVGCILTVKVVEAEGLVAADRSGFSDPYARLSFEQQKKQTKVIKQTLNPKWNESFEFEISDPAASLLIEIYDHDLLGSHDFLGSVHIPVALLVVEVLRDEWHELQPRAFRDDVVSGRLRLQILVANKRDGKEDTTGLECYPWIDLSRFRQPTKRREHHTFRVYFCSSYVDFQEEFKALHQDVFPKIKIHCESQGYTFTPVDMRNGFDDRTDKLYMYNPYIARICFEEIEHCRKISPRVNFFAILGDRYGCSTLPITLDKNELMAIRGSVNDDVIAEGTDTLREIQQLLETWYILDENQVPSRFVLRSEVQGISAHAPVGTDKHNEWIRISNILFKTLNEKSKKLLAPLRQHKYFVSLLEQEITLGLLLPDDAHEHVYCIVRGLANLRVVNPQSARFVDIKGRHCDCLDDGIKEIRLDMIDEERRNRLSDLKVICFSSHFFSRFDVVAILALIKVYLQRMQLRVRAKLATKYRFIQAQWQGLSVTKNHIPEFCSAVLTFLKGLLKMEVLQHRQYARNSAKIILRGKSVGVSEVFESRRLGGAKLAWQRVMEYLSSRSDGSLKPFLLRGGHGSGVSTILAAIVECCHHEISSPASGNPIVSSEGTCLVYRQVGLTPSSMNGGKLLSGILTELRCSYEICAKNDLALDIKIIEGLDLPAADFGGTSDPYVIISVRNVQTRAVIENIQLKSSIQNKTLNPQWNERFYVEGLAVDQELVFKVFDNDLISADDLLGYASVLLSTLSVNKTAFLTLPLRANDDSISQNSSQTETFLSVKVMEGKDLLPTGRRMSLDPYILLHVENITDSSVETTHKTRTSKPHWDESFVFAIPEGTPVSNLRAEVWDKGGEGGQKGLVGSFVVDISQLQIGECLDGWHTIQSGLARKGRSPRDAQNEAVDGSSSSSGGGQVRLVLTKEVAAKVSQAGRTSRTNEDSDLIDQDSGNVFSQSFYEKPEEASTKSKSSAETGPRLRIEVTLVSSVKSVEQALEGKSWGGPWTYKELSLAFSESRASGLLMASATKPIIMVIDGLHNLPSNDITTSLKWLPTLLPRNVHLIFGYSCDTNERILDTLLQRKPAMKVVDISQSDTLSADELSNDPGYGADYARAYMLRCLERRSPVANLTEVQRASFMHWMSPGCRPLILKLISEIAVCVPSSSAPLASPPSSYNAVACIHKAFLSLLTCRVQYINNGRIDVSRLWRVLDLLASVPTHVGGLSEEELNTLLSVENQASIPGFFLSEIFLTLKPVLEIKSVGNRLVYSLEHNIYKSVIRSRQSSGDIVPTNYTDLTSNLIVMAKGMLDFDAGGLVNIRKLLFLPNMLNLIGETAEFERILGDLEQLGLRVSSEMLWEMLMEMRLAGPGASGIQEELLNLLEEYAVILDQRPALLFQLAMNMPDISQVHKAAKLMDIRKRYILYQVYLPYQRAEATALEQSKSKTKSRTLVPDSTGKQHKPSAVTESDMMVLHPLAMEWKSAKSWIRWCNKPQSREHRKLTLENQPAPVSFVVYCDNGSAILTSCSNGYLALWSSVTGEVMQSFNLNEMGSKPGTALSLSPDQKVLLVGGEDGKLHCWDMIKSDTESRVRLSSKPKYTVLLHSGRVNGLAFLSNSLIVTSGDDKEVRIVEVESGRERNSFTPCRMAITALDCSVATNDDHGLIATGSLSLVKLWRGGTLDSRGSLHSPLQHRVSALKFCPRPKVSPLPALLLAVAEWAMDVFVWKQVGAQRWLLSWKLNGNTGPVRSLAWIAPFDKPNTRLASGGLDCSVCLWSIQHQYNSDEPNTDESESGLRYCETLSPAASIAGHTSSVLCVSFHPHGNLAVSSSQDGAISVWDTNAAIAAALASSSTPVIRHSGNVACVDVVHREDELLLISGGADGRAKLWELGTNGKGELLASVEAKHVASITSVSLTASGRFFLTASADGVIKRWDSKAPFSCTSQVKAHRGGVAKLRSHPIGDYLLSSGRTDGRVTLWDVDSMQDVAILENATTKTVLQAAFSSDGRMVITADPASVRLWSVELSRELLVLPIGDGQEWTHADFSSDGRYLVTSAAGSIKFDNRGLIVWDASKGLLREGRLTEMGMNDDVGDVVAISMSVDARYICATFKSRWLHVWHLPTRTCQGSLLLSGDPSPALCTGSAWPRIVAADTTGSLYIFDFVSPEPPNPGDESDSEDHKAA